MNAYNGIIRILDSTTQAGPKMVEALAAYGDGKMGSGILKLADWSRQDGKSQGLLQGRIEGAAAASIISSVCFAAITFFMHRQLKKEEQRNQETIADLFDEIATYESERKTALRTAEKAKENSINAPNVSSCPDPVMQ